MASLTSVAAEIKSVLITTDLSHVSDKPLWHALAIARHYHAKLYVAHVVSSVGYAIAGPPALELASEATVREVKQLEQNWTENGLLRGLEHEFIVRQGDIWTQVKSVIEEKQVGLVVVGTHGRRSLGKVFLGSVAEQIFRRADPPVLTVGPATAPNSPIDNGGSLRPFVFATDFGATSVQALPLAISFANHFGAKLVLLHVAPIAPIPESLHWSRTTTDVRRMQDDVRRPALKRLEEMLSQCEKPAIEPEFLVKFGIPSKMIVHEACSLGADLIVMGLNHSRYLGTTPHLPGGTAYQVVCEAGCSVLTVRS